MVKPKRSGFLAGCLLLLTSMVLTAQGIDRQLCAFDFEMDGLSVPERVELFERLGYSGVTFAVKNDAQRQKLGSYRSTTAVATGRISIPVVYFPYDFSNNAEEENEHWRKTLAVLPQGTALWVIINEPGATKDKTLALLKEMANTAAASGKEVVIYPHDNTFIESAEEAIPYLESLNLPNLSLTLHLCHELRAGNGDRLLDVAVKAAPYLTFASLSGANKTMVPNKNANWSDAIKPLDEGDYSVEDFIHVLQKIDFKGKTVLHTFGIKQSPENHLARSLAVWEEKVASTYVRQNSDLNHILDNPESAHWDSGSGSWFISNLGGEKVTLEKDGYGWISRLNERGEVISNRWVEGLDAPTGMASFKNFLYVGDRGVLVIIDIEAGKVLRKIPLPGSAFINDVAASPKGEVYVSDTFMNRIYRIKKNKIVEVFVQDDKLEYPNGLLVDGDNLVVATWGPMTDRATFATSRKGTLMTVNLKNRNIEPVGAGAPMANFDGIVKYDGAYYATDWTGGRLLKITAAGDVEEVLTGFAQFADLGLNPETGMLMVPEMSKNRFIKVYLKQVR